MGSAADHFALSDLCRTFWRYRGRMLAVFLVVSSAAIGVILLYPKSYASEGRLFIRLGRESVTLDPTAATAGEIVSLNESRESEINSAVEIMRSRLLIEQVVDQIGADVILNASPSESDSAADVAKHRDAAIERLEKTVDIGSLKKSSVVSVVSRARTPELAQQITAALIDVYLQHHLQVNRTPGSLEFFKSQVALLSTSLEESERAISDRKNKLRLLSLEGKRDGLLRQINEIESERLTVDRGLSAGRARQQALEASLADLPDTVMAEEVQGLPNAAADAMRSQLYALEIRERELQSLMSDDHPRLAAVRRQIEEARAVLTDQPEQRQQRTSRLNANAETLRLDLLSERANVASLEARRTSLLAQEAELQEGLERFNEAEIEIAALQRQVDRLTAEFTSYSQRLEQARIGAALQEQQVTNVNVVQPATLSLKPVAPNRRLLAALGVLMALASAAGVALIGAALKPTIDTAEQLAGYLGVPVLATVPLDPRYEAFVQTPVPNVSH